MVGHFFLATSASRLHLFANAKGWKMCKALLNQTTTSTIQTAVKLHHHYTFSRRYESSRGLGNTLSMEYDIDATSDVTEKLLSLPAPPSPSILPSPSIPTTWERIKKRTGLSTLLPEWKLMLSKENVMKDLTAGITVGCVAMPLSLAIALASGVSPEMGLVSAIVGGTVACLLGGAPLGVTGPSLATTVLLSGVASTYGMSALVFVTCVTGGLQVLSGAMRLGGLVRFVPQPVIAGFTAGVGGVMLFNQLPRMLGVVGPSAPGILEMVNHVMTQLGNIHPASVVLSLGTLATTMLLPKVYPKVPASVVAVVGASALNALLGLGAPVIGAIPCTFPFPSIPSLPDFETMYSLMGASLTLYGLTSLESLLSGTAADKIDKEDLRKHEPNVELVGQGLSNLAVSCFGGIPVTGAIARTSLNINAGAKTRRASMFHVGILGGAFALGPVVGLIPLSALSGILLSVAIRLLNPREIKYLSKISYRELAPLAATFGAVMASDLVTGVQVGVATAVAMQVFRRSSPSLLTAINEENVVKMEGDVTFLSASRIAKLQEELESLPVPSSSSSLPLTLDFSGVVAVDATAGEMVIDMITVLEEMGHNPQTLNLVGLSEEHSRVLSVCDSRKTFTKFIKSN